MTEDLGVNEIKGNPPSPPLGKGANKGSFPKGAGAKHLRIFNQEILRPSAEILGANSTANAQNDMVVGINISSGVIPCLTRNRKNKQTSTILRFFGLCPQNDRKYTLSNGRGRNCAQVSAQTISGEGLLKNEILNYPTSTLPCNAHSSHTRGAEVQDDVWFENDVVCHSERSEESQSRTHRNNCPLTPTPSPNWRGEKKPAFTLAEVLVTLGIIGVVAAMTLPMLARNYQFFIRQQQFKKAYAEFSNAVQKTQIDMGEGVKCFYLNGVYDPNNRRDCDYFYAELAKNLNVLRVCQKKALEGKCIPPNFRGGEVVINEIQPEFLEYFSVHCTGYTGDVIKNKSKVYLLS
ncbi:type II secretion system protein, partial [bacterium]|nr:type II secretion system protein [bacterium]